VTGPEQLAGGLTVPDARYRAYATFMMLLIISTGWADRSATAKPGAVTGLNGWCSDQSPRETLTDAMPGDGKPADSAEMAGVHIVGGVEKLAREVMVLWADGAGGGGHRRR
jgi:hypothetical protein